VVSRPMILLQVLLSFKSKIHSCLWHLCQNYKWKLLLSMLESHMRLLMISARIAVIWQKFNIHLVWGPKLGSIGDVDQLSVIPLGVCWERITSFVPLTQIRASSAFWISDSPLVEVCTSISHTLLMLKAIFIMAFLLSMLWGPLAAGRATLQCRKFSLFHSHVTTWGC
jgi:hypothetical protein